MNPSPTPIPEGLDLIEDYQGAIIRRRWFSHIVWALVIFTVPWDSFLVFWYSSLLGHQKSGSFEWIAAIFPVGHLAIGVGLTYFIACLFLNKTDLILTPDALQVATDPLPWIGSKIVPREELSGFLVRKKINNSTNGISISYKVSYIDAANREKTLLRSVSNREQADYICQYLNRFYGFDRAQ